MDRNIVAILRGVTNAEAVEFAGILIEEGITKIEVPLNSPNPYDSISAMIEAHGDKALFGAGTVLEVAQVEKLAALGAGLIVSPDCNIEVIKATKAAGMKSYPGVMTPTECFAALRAGADGLKLFPGSMVGANNLKAIRAVLPAGTEVLAVGGAGPENFDQWKAAGADGFGIGSAIYKVGMSADELRANAKAIVMAYDAVYGI